MTHPWRVVWAQVVLSPSAVPVLSCFKRLQDAIWHRVSQLADHNIPVGLILGTPCISLHHNTNTPTAAAAAASIGMTGTRLAIKAMQSLFS